MRPIECLVSNKKDVPNTHVQGILCHLIPSFHFVFLQTKVRDSAYKWLRNSDQGLRNPLPLSGVKEPDNDSGTAYSIFPNNSSNNPRDLQFFSWEQLRIRFVLRLEEILSVFTAQALQCEFTVQDSDDDLADFRFTATLHEDEVALVDAGIDHAVAAHAKKERGGLIADQILVETDGFLRLLLDRFCKSCGNGSEEREREGGARLMGHFAFENLDTTLRILFQLLLAYEHVHHFGHRVLAAYTKCDREVSKRRRVPTFLLKLADVLEDCLLVRRQGHEAGVTIVHHHRWTNVHCQPRIPLNKEIG